MKKRMVCLTLALIISAAQVVSVSASREEELREEQAMTSQQLDATYSRIDELWGAKEQLEGEIATLDSNLVDVMVSIDVLEGDISNKETDIVKTKQDLGKAQNARDKQYEAMKKRIQYLYEKGGDDAWFQMMMNAENLADLLTRAEYTQKLYEQDRQSLEKYVNTIDQIDQLKEKYQQEKAELEGMKAEYEEQSANLQYQIDEKRATSADCDNEIAYAQEQAAEYANLLAEQSAEIERLEAERIAAEEEARRQAEAEEAARQAAAEAAAAEAENNGEESEAEEADGEQEVRYDEDGNVIENEDGESDGESDAEPEYDEYGNVIDSENTVSDEDGGEESQSGGSSGGSSSVVDYATQFVGNPYVYGGTSLTGGTDCSGFVQSVYSNFGVSLPRTSYEQMGSGYEVPYSEAQAGDLICYGGHIAIYMGDGQIVHASNSAPYPAGGIKISDNAAYRTILSVRRVI